MKGIAACVVALILAALMALRADASPTQTERLIYQRFGFGWTGRTMVCIARRESHLNPSAINWRDQHANGRGSFGLFQIGRIHVGMVGGDWRRLLDPVTNINVAYRLYRSSGLRPWGGGC
jgi:hypothetical protein